MKKNKLATNSLKMAGASGSNTLAQSQICPTCGTCPTCGKKNTQPYYPYYPEYPYPNPIMSPFVWGGIGTIGTTVTNTKVNR